MKFEVLLSCMHEIDLSIIRKSNLDEVQTLVINQCKIDKACFTGNEKHRMYNTPTRGLSVSRNLGIQQSNADVCLISDNDEVFRSDLESLILKYYDKLPDADIIIFKMANIPTKLGEKVKRLKKYELLRVSSWQISFKLSSVKGKIWFDEKMGAGTPNGASEENKFLLDCHKKGLKIYYVPEIIATLSQEQSTWFDGYDERFFFNRGKATKHYLGTLISVVYGLYFIVMKYNLYSKDISAWQASKALAKGLMAKDIDSKYEE